MRLREWLELRSLAQDRYDAHSGEQHQLRRLADTYGLDPVLDWLRAGVPTPELDVPTLADLLAAGVTARRFRWFFA